MPRNPEQLVSSADGRWPPASVVEIFGSECYAIADTSEGPDPNLGVRLRAECPRTTGRKRRRNATVRHNRERLLRLPRARPLRQSVARPRCRLLRHVVRSNRRGRRRPRLVCPLGSDWRACSRCRHHRRYVHPRQPTRPYRRPFKPRRFSQHLHKPRRFRRRQFKPHRFKSRPSLCPRWIRRPRPTYSFRNRFRSQP